MRVVPSAIFAALYAVLAAGAFGGDLISAARNVDPLLVRSILAANPKAVFDTNRDGETALHWACIKGEAGIAGLLLGAGAEVNAKSRKGWTPLHWAVYNGNKELAELLLQHGAQVNALNKELWSPLHVAAYEGNVDVVRLLLSRGADAGAKDRSGVTPFQTAAENWRALMEALSCAGSGIKPEEQQIIAGLISILSGKGTSDNDPERLKSRLKELQTQVKSLKEAETGLASERKKTARLEKEIKANRDRAEELENRLKSERDAAQNEARRLHEELQALGERERAREEFLAECSVGFATNMTRLLQMQEYLDGAIADAAMRLQQQANERRAEWELLSAEREIENYEVLNEMSVSMEGLLSEMRAAGEQAEALLAKMNRVREQAPDENIGREQQ